MEQPAEKSPADLAADVVADWWSDKLGDSFSDELDPLQLAFDPGILPDIWAEPEDVVEKLSEYCINDVRVGDRLVQVLVRVSSCKPLSEVFKCWRCGNDLKGQPRVTISVDGTMVDVDPDCVYENDQIVTCSSGIMLAE